MKNIDKSWAPYEDSEGCVEINEEYSTFYVRKSRRYGFTFEQARKIDEFRNSLKNGECITTEEALELARNVLNYAH